MSDMVTEIAEIDVIAGSEMQFELAVAQAEPNFRAAKGCGRVTLGRSAEYPYRYRLMVEWDSIDDHMAFRATPAFQIWRSLAGPHFATAPRVEHVTTVFESR